MGVTANDRHSGYKARLMLSGVSALTYWCGLVSNGWCFVVKPQRIGSIFLTELTATTHRSQLKAL